MATKRLTNRDMLEAIYKKFIKEAGHFGMDSGPQEPVPLPKLPPQLNLYPEAGVVYKNADIAVPPGFQKMFDYANREVVLVKVCGPLGG
jgi:hypothetical protein